MTTTKRHPYYCVKPEYPEMRLHSAESAGHVPLYVTSYKRRTLSVVDPTPPKCSVCADEGQVPCEVPDGVPVMGGDRYWKTCPACEKRAEEAATALMKWMNDHPRSEIVHKQTGKLLSSTPIKTGKP